MAELYLFFTEKASYFKSKTPQQLRGIKLVTQRAAGYLTLAAAESHT